MSSVLPSLRYVVCFGTALSAVSPLVGEDAWAAGRDAPVEEASDRGARSSVALHPESHRGKSLAKKKKKQDDSEKIPGSIEQLLVLGHRPNASTDGTGTYTVSAVTTTKMLMKLQDVPQSISVLSTQQMKDQNLNTVDAALKQVAGVNVNLYGDGTAGYSARGFALQPQYDGVPASGSLNLSQQYDLAIYDRIEVLRGPSGLLQGAGSPAGSTNFVHKRPTEEFQGNASFSAGSWNNYHATVDVGGPIGNSKIVSTRLVLAGTDRNFFYKNAYDRRWTIYSVTDVHLSRHDTLTVMVSSQSNDTMRFMGLPRSSTGADLKLPRNSFIGANWNASAVPMTEVEAQLEHLFSHGWRARVNVRHRSSETTLQYAYLNSYNAKTQTGNFVAANTKYSEVNDGVDAYVTGPVHLFGQTHQLMLGSDFNHYVYNGGGASLTATSDPQLGGISAFAPALLSGVTLPSVKNRYREPTDQWGVYGQAQIKPVSSVSILLGGRISGYVSKEQRVGPTRGASDTQIDQQGILTPYIGGVWHVIPSISLYTSYTSIFSPQSAFDTTGRLAPVRGNQIEGGVKGDLLDHKLGFTLAGYKIIQRNQAVYNGALSAVCGPSRNDDCYVATGKTRSQGAEAEVIGRPANGWDINASYTFNDNAIINNGNASQAGLVYASNSPRHLWKLWTHYRFEPYPGAEKNIWSIGGGINAQSGTFGNSRLVTQKGYIVASLQAGYQWNRYLAGTVTLNNISNTRYYQRLGTVYYYNYYGEPRNFMFTLRSNF
ncbi:TonB-dependent siderophore receptor [Acetobacter conturbans]|uniref:TonB-dependent siderophore receptor n=1 Tax=Acetobacter conturbans TaxID=1737472 RepID=A0ABX0K027_9PROT|nr:TonB-dependent siderophore receptor [Acetobacter conturbans]NHN89072.1 TonB-dependent siderophore receptor [Acetobacter conturbans]